MTTPYKTRVHVTLTFCVSVCIACESNESSATGTDGNSSDSSVHAIVKLGMYSDANCTVPLLQNGVPFVVEMETASHCFYFTYVDPEGVTIDTSHANFKCTEEGVIYDKYPFSSDCTDSSTFAGVPNYFVGTHCQYAKSHEGGVFEKLIDYSYPGSPSCTINANAQK